MNNTLINSERFISTLHELRNIGSRKTGVVRQAFSTDDIRARHWLRDELTSIGLRVTIDAAGNVFGCPPDNCPCLLLGSHTDTQPQGGWLDGALGVVAALEIARSRQERGEAPIAVVSFQDEEGRFGGTTGSMVWTDELTLEQADKLEDVDGVTFGTARRALLQDEKPRFVSIDRFTGFLELHIEQGPFLINSNDVVGVVNRVVGIRQCLFRFTGEQNHAGTTPMDKRKDAFRALSEFCSRLDAVLQPLAQPATVWTIGHVRVYPNAQSVVPGAVDFTMQWRDTSETRLDEFRSAILQLVKTIEREFGIQSKFEEAVAIPVATMNDELRKSLCTAARELTGDRFREMPSAAIHDAGIVSRHLPTAMLFIPSIGGVSHTFAEDSHIEHLVIGAEVLAKTVSLLLSSENNLTN